MAFSFDTFVEDQKQAAIDVVDTVTPSQIKQVASAYKEGLNASPKQVINETLEKFTGVDLSQGVGLDGVGAQVKDFIKGQAAGLTMQLEQQILGCINTQIRDLMNKVPAIDFILNFEDKINGILGNFRNKLEFKIDAELRKLAYNKIKIQQVTLFKQRIRAQIKDICPGAAPASVAEVQDFNNKIKGFIDKRKSANKTDDTENTIPLADINTSGSGKARYVTRDEEQGSSNNFVKKMKQPGEAEALAKEKAPELAAVVTDEAIDQTSKWMTEEEKKQNKEFAAQINAQIAADPNFKGSKTATTENRALRANAAAAAAEEAAGPAGIPGLLETETTENIADKQWKSYAYYVATLESFPQDGGFYNQENVESVMLTATPTLMAPLRSAAERGVDELKGAAYREERKKIVSTLKEGDYLLGTTAQGNFTRRATAAGMHLDDPAQRIWWQFSIQERKGKFPVNIHSSKGGSTHLGNTSGVANTKALAKMEYDIQEGTISFFEMLNS
tara:strand:- start:204 stop:1709 length:1506 start_codon:yes stop_codon:yes gene_type:complete